MARLVTIDNKNHLTLKVDPRKAEMHGAELHLIPAVLSEFSDLAVQYPILLAKNEDSGQFTFTAMFGFELGENLYWQNNAWQGLYLPLQIRRQPFFITNDDNEGQQSNNKTYAVCIDMDSPTVTTKGDVALFNDNGLDSDYFQQAKAVLVQLLKGEKSNEQLIKHLQVMDLIQPLSLDITFVNQQSITLNGLYTIDQEKLAKLKDEQVLTLHQAGFLPAIHTMITSLGQVHALIEKKNQQLIS
ncbi:MAG: hypothetical protein ACI9LM_001783 [Alteromonadaceae bacterium]|jgi:hypothetical protein